MIKKFLLTIIRIIYIPLGFLFLADAACIVFALIGIIPRSEILTYIIAFIVFAVIGVPFKILERKLTGEE